MVRKYMTAASALATSELPVFIGAACEFERQLDSNEQLLGKPPGTLLRLSLRKLSKFNTTVPRSKAGTALLQAGCGYYVLRAVASKTLRIARHVRRAICAIAPQEDAMALTRQAKPTKVVQAATDAGEINRSDLELGAALDAGSWKHCLNPLLLAGKPPEQTLHGKRQSARGRWGISPRRLQMRASANKKIVAKDGPACKDNTGASVACGARILCLCTPKTRQA